VGDILDLPGEQIYTVMIAGSSRTGKFTSAADKFTSPTSKIS
jgi:hypothetical protein